MKKPKLEILIKKLNDKQTDSLFYYSGQEIARLGKCILIVSGHITLKFKENECSYKDDNAVDELRWRKFTDKKLYNQLYDKNFIDENNWFEVISDKGESVMGDVASTYDEAISLLKTYHAEKVYE